MTGDMRIIDFTRAHITEAYALAMSSYAEEREYVQELPIVDSLPDISDFADNGLGVAAVEGERLMGFLSFYQPWDNAFGSGSRGTYAPIHAHGAVYENRERIYKRMYQVAANKLVRAGVGCHAVGLYAHDVHAINAFYTYGFGLRCIDAIRRVETIPLDSACSFITRRLERNEVAFVRQLRRMLTEHLGQSPCFMRSTPHEIEEWLIRAESRASILFAAFDRDQAIAFIEVAEDGENFATAVPDMRNICGAFCLPQYRGTNVALSLLNLAITELKTEGCIRIGVDFESFNPTAYGFWLKYFTSYTHSVVRRIDINP